VRAGVPSAGVFCFSARKLTAIGVECCPFWHLYHFRGPWFGSQCHRLYFANGVKWPVCVRRRLDRQGCNRGRVEKSWRDLTGRQGSELVVLGRSRWVLRRFQSSQEDLASFRRAFWGDHMCRSDQAEFHPEFRLSIGWCIDFNGSDCRSRSLEDIELSRCPL